MVLISLYIGRRNKGGSLFISAAALIKLFSVKVRRFFESGAYSSTFLHVFVIVKAYFSFCFNYFTLMSFAEALKLSSCNRKIVFLSFDV